MNTKSLIPSLLLPAALAWSAMTFAADPATPKAAPDAKTAAATKASTDKIATECASNTGTRLKVAKGRCNPAKVTVYTQDEIQSTGKIDTGEALKQLDPRFY
jgi:hypothetical protein